MSDKWIFNVRSLWVIAEREGITDYGAWKALTDWHTVLTTETNGVIDLPTFSTPEGAKKYIQAGNLQEVEPMSFGESVATVAGFLQHMDELNVVHILLDPIWGYRNVRRILIKDLRRDIIAELDRHAPPHN